VYLTTNQAAILANPIPRMRTFLPVTLSQIRPYCRWYAITTTRQYMQERKISGQSFSEV
jgi:hypothetical protein